MIYGISFILKVLLLGYLACQDEKEGLLPNIWIAALAGVCILEKGIESGMESGMNGGLNSGLSAAGGFLDPAALLAFLPGIFLWLLSLLTHEQIGRGDAYVLWALGFSGRGDTAWQIFFSGMLINGGRALWVLLAEEGRRERDKKKESGRIPAVAGFFAAMLLMLPELLGH